MNAQTNQQRFLGGLYGSLVGDALGVPVEFKPRADRVADPVTGMRDYGTHGQPAGTWSDDGALLLCSVESLVEKGFDTEDMGARFVRWCNLGHWTAHGTVFDIGIATRKALLLIEQGCPAELAGGQDQYDNGNGSLMRILPVALAFHLKDETLFCSHLDRASAITHGHQRSQMACVFYGLMVRGLIYGLDPQAALQQAQVCFVGIYEKSEEFSHFVTVMQPTLGTLPESQIGSGGYVMETLTAALWCLLTTSSFSECVLKAVNLGDDTDTTGCVAGGLAGVYYGLDSIPKDWQAKLPRQQSLHDLFHPFIPLCAP
ncbi:ADP-ribosylglycohydrolase family protein [Prosthecobacter dejongeii]|uniref:ADP-ribosylglycohydrolase n=1 Tax=Prosthecobacter dejongeii TaxID=48465 RepID=A0A7W8DNN2_9BACT|nr:ADP-ribosylglycohydrolase family protein [Prosthecobacter dejongeii]MBB5036558.1 ADP-ribosylglycohydrolase [Prosthecobacter dejongeii]